MLTSNESYARNLLKSFLSDKDMCGIERIEKDGKLVGLQFYDLSIFNSEENSFFGAANVNNIETITSIVSDFLINVGIPANISGYKYLRQAIPMVYINPTKYQMTTKSLYPEIAKKFDTSSFSVERCIRHAIERGFSSSSDLLNDIFGNYSTFKEKGKVTNSEFIFGTIYYLKDTSK